MSFIQVFLGKKNYQRFFRRLYHLSLRGMNYGRASDYEHNGEAMLIDTIRSMIDSPTAILFDVGANQGVFTRNLMATWRDRKYALYAFEPSAKTFAILKREVPDVPVVHLVNLGLGEVPGKVELYTDKEGSGLASVYPRDLSHHRINFSGRETIELTTLDQFCAQHQIDHIDFLKLDVEGHELAVLKGGQRMIGEGRVRIIQFEFGGCNIDSRTYFRDYFNFFQKAYHLHRVLSDGLEPLPEYSEKLEVFQSANYLAIRK